MASTGRYTRRGCRNSCGRYLSQGVNKSGAEVRIENLLRKFVCPTLGARRGHQFNACLSRKFAGCVNGDMSCKVEGTEVGGFRAQSLFASLPQTTAALFQVVFLDLYMNFATTPPVHANAFESCFGRDCYLCPMWLETKNDQRRKGRKGAAFETASLLD